MFKPTDTELKISGGLTSTFIRCDTCLSGEDYNRLRQHELSEKETHILQGLLGGSVSGVMERGAIASNTQSKQAQNRKSQEEKTTRFIELVEQIRASIEQMEADIRALEELFEKRDGDAWREKLALKILGADNIPQQESDETIKAYRERLEILLIDQLLNPDGSIKGEYIDHPELGDYARWAQKQFHHRNAKAAVAELEDKNTTPQRQEQILVEMKERGSLEEIVLAEDLSNEHMNSSTKIKAIQDETYDVATSTALSKDAGLKFNGS